MPLFMDRHDGVEVSPEELADAHNLDLATQDRYGVKYHSYWFDPERQSVFCLVEGPSIEAVESVHRDSHGLTADTILELDPSTPLNEMLGAPPHHPPGEPYVASALRAIVFTDIRGSVAQTHELGDDAHLAVLRDHNRIVRDALGRHRGTQVKHTGDGIMASFDSVSSAVAFAIDVQAAIDQRNAAADVPLEVGIGISAGEPVTDDSDDLFGAAVQLAARLCSVAEPGEIATSVAVRELCVGKPFRFEDRGAVSLKGLPEPTRLFMVTGRD